MSIAPMTSKQNMKPSIAPRMIKGVGMIVLFLHAVMTELKLIMLDDNIQMYVDKTRIAITSGIAISKNGLSIPAINIRQIIKLPMNQGIATSL